MAVFRALQLGDLICAVPALRALRRGWPAANITLIGLPWARTFAERYAHLLDDFLSFPGYPGLHEMPPDPAAWPAFVATARACRFDLALQLHGRGEVTNDIVGALGAADRAGFHPRDAKAPAGCFVPWQETGHEIRRLLTLVDALGLPRQGVGLEFPLHADEVAQAAALRADHGLEPGEYVCVHPGARLSSRRWPVEYFARVARDIARTGLRVVVTGSTGERSLAAQLAAQVAGAIDLTGATSLGVLGALVRDARLVLCNDTGVSHVAAALETPSVVISCGADPERFAPLDRTRHEVLHEPMPCRPCAHDRCPVGHGCAWRLEPARVARRVLERLAAPVPPTRRHAALAS